MYQYEGEIMRLMLFSNAVIHNYTEHVFLHVLFWRGRKTGVPEEKRLKHKRYQPWESNSHETPHQT